MATYDGRPADYSDLIYRHLDRMSDSLKHGLEVGEIKNATFLMSYYLFVLHLDTLLRLKMSRAELGKIKEYKRALPSFQKVWSGRLDENIEFLDSLSNWFHVLILVANNSGFLTMTPVVYKGYEDEMEDENDRGSYPKRDIGKR